MNKLELASGPIMKNRKRIEKRLSDAKEDIHFFVEHLVSNPNNLSLIRTTALDIARCGFALEAKQAEIIESLTLACQASYSLLLCSTKSNVPLKVEIGQVAYLLEKKCDESLVSASLWIQTFLLALICDRVELVDDLCELKPSELKVISAAEPEYKYLLAKAMRSIWLEEQDAGSCILEAMKETDPGLPQITAPAWTLHIDVPLLKLSYDILSKDVDFTKNFIWAAKLNGEFWSSESRVDDWDGFLSLELTGMLAWARRRGLTIGDIPVARILI